MEEIPALDGAPTHLASDDGKRWFLIRSSNWIAGHFGIPVYLCGSALRDDNPNPRDWDIRLNMPDEDFELRFGSVADWVEEGATGLWTDVRWKWSAECVKRHREMSRETGLNIDFQIYPESHALKQYGHLPKLRLDTKGD